MLRALAVAARLISLGDDAVSLVEGLINLVKGHDARAQREALDAAYAAAENVLARRLRP